MNADAMHSQTTGSFTKDRTVGSCHHAPDVRKENNILSPVHLIKWSGINEATAPHLIYQLYSLHIIFDARSIHHAQGSSPPHAVLHALTELILAPTPKLSREPTLST